MVKSATITVKDDSAPTEPAPTPVVAAAKAQAIKTLAVEKTAIRRDAYSNDNWKRRRSVIYASLIFLGGCIGYLVFLAPDDELRRSLAIPLLGAYVSVILGYAGFATLDDTNKRTTLAASDVAPEE